MYEVVNASLQEKCDSSILFKKRKEVRAESSNHLHEECNNFLDHLPCARVPSHALSLCAAAASIKSQR